MPKMQVYLPAELHARVKRRGTEVNVSRVLQAALDDALAELDRQDALAEAVASYEDEHGSFDDEELDRLNEEDRAQAAHVRRGS